MIPEPFCWVPLEGLRRLAALPDRDRKAATLLYLGLAALAAEARDGEHAGFEATGAEVAGRVGFHRNTLYAARDALAELGLLAVEGGSEGPNARRWTLLQVHDESAARCTTVVHPAGAQDSLLLEEPQEGGFASPLHRVFECWRLEVPGKSACRLTPGRRQKIAARLRAFDPDQLVRAVRQAARDPFLNGDNDRGKTYTDFKTIFRNDEKVEELLEDADRWEANGGAAPRRPAPETAGQRAAREKDERIKGRLAAAGQEMP